MAKRGDAAREAVKNTIIAAFQIADGYVGYLDKKIYVQAKDGAGGEPLQFAISLTMPKTAVNADAESIDGAPVVLETELSAQDQVAVEKLKQKLIELGVYQE